MPAGGGPQDAAGRAHHGGDLRSAAGGDRARRLPCAEGQNLPHATQEALDRLEDMGVGITARCAIVGAGYAGMAAAVTLAEKGIAVTVFEAGSVPGGRARRIVSQGNELDNGQHILIGAYAELLRLMRVVGVPENAVL